MCDCKGCQFVQKELQIESISINPRMNIYYGYDGTIDDRDQRLGIDPRNVPPQHFYTRFPDEWVCAESRRTIALEAIRRWQAYLAEVEQEIQDGGPAWR